MQKNFWILTFIAVLVLQGNHLLGQAGETSPFVDCPLEEIDVHLSGNSFFTGEILWFKIYCTSQLFPGDELSNIAFIELVSSDNNSIIRKKILLKHGEGSGEFEIPNNLPTGLYYILSYTNWMKNFGEESFSRDEIAIINPNQPYRNKVSNSDSLQNLNINSADILTSDQLEIIPDKSKYFPRGSVNLKIITPGTQAKLSVSVSREEPRMIYNIQKNIASRIKYPKNIIYLPDFKGIRMSGKLTDPSGNAISGELVTICTPGPGTDLKGSITDNAGVYNFLLKPKEGTQQIIMSLPSNDTRTSLEESYWNGFRDPPGNMVLSLDSKAVSFLKEKFSDLQIQSRFKLSSYLKNDQATNEPDSNLFYTKPDQLIKFKDYINLDSLREYIYELVPSVKFTRKNGESEIMVFDQTAMSFLSGQPGIFIDGVLYNDFSEIAKIPVRDIDRMAIISSDYYYKDFTFGGIIDIHTKKSDFNSVKLLAGMNRFIYPMADANDIKFNAPDYSLSGSETRIPDFRYLLLWEPYISTDRSGVATVHFYTGDVKGTFIVKVVGISENGEKLQAVKEILIDN